VAFTIDVNIVSAKEQLYSGTAKSITVTCALGEVGIQPHHAPMLGALKPGDARILTEHDQHELFYVSGGIIEVQPHIVTILADIAIRAEDIDEAAATEVINQARGRLREKISGEAAELEYSKALQELAQAVAMLRTVRDLHKWRGGVI